ncbi:hypothetical protein B0H15DRAFT_187390 [Mycena belliarum]|uniref:Uncharacterized protein n=1 Tax=Mycena belliarum TaxID=1033014 RepID=A0AAD6U6S1_9AGAR|nr:hypothetical protein B0H15DRAFT_187390 [Mycena belliae]
MFQNVSCRRLLFFSFSVTGAGKRMGHLRRTLEMIARIRRWCPANKGGTRLRAGGHALQLQQNLHVVLRSMRSSLVCARAPESS